MLYIQCFSLKDSNRFKTTVPAPPGVFLPGSPRTGVFLPVKRHRGEPGHTRDTRDTRTHKGTQTNLTTNQTHQQQTPRTSARRPKPRPTQQPQARSQPLPAADSEEAAPSKPDPASAISQCASPRLLKGGRRNEVFLPVPGTRNATDGRASGSPQRDRASRREERTNVCSRRALWRDAKCADA